MYTPVFDSVDFHSSIHGRVLQISDRVKIHGLRQARVLARVAPLSTIYHTYSIKQHSIIHYLYYKH